jgi:hypothetical protein
MSQEEDQREEDLPDPEEREEIAQQGRIQQIVEEEDEGPAAA